MQLTHYAQIMLKRQILHILKTQLTQYEAVQQLYGLWSVIMATQHTVVLYKCNYFQSILTDN